ncbi:hypothetical protein SBOR_7783 [Sclerotinia borealis F-4128]|uniref:Mid2 domain-containing protein n=1 Tax=Sclerotinia borealis (strain F-4128) TaxID=1432307 RepID=W9C7M1_SCLBF|nr:hypothetical protein SBOR_7783 [Sclerotinia borealis F-4128]
MHHIIYLALSCWLARPVKGQCYSYAGVEMDPTYKACNGSAPVSMCCHLGASSNGGDECGSGSTYGLCGISGSQLWRESCTDKTWQSPGCLQLCVGVNDTKITACPDGSYCCGKNAIDCCNAKEGKFIVNNRVSDTAVVDSSSSQTSQTASASSVPISIPASEFGSTSTSAVSLSTVVQTSTVQPSVIITTVFQPLPTAMSTNSSTNAPKPLSIGAKVGIAVGTGAGIVGLLALTAFFWKRKQTNGKSHELSATEVEQSPADFVSRPKYVYRAEVDGAIPKPVETHGYGRRSEPAEML